jgi:hypothetical protein
VSGCSWGGADSSDPVVVLWDGEEGEAAPVWGVDSSWDLAFCGQPTNTNASRTAEILAIRTLKSLFLKATWFLWNDDFVPRLQKNVLLQIFSPDHSFVVERELLFLAVHIA